jgi:hypothetical protein
MIVSPIILNHRKNPSLLLIPAKDYMLTQQKIPISAWDKNNAHP